MNTVDLKAKFRASLDGLSGPDASIEARRDAMEAFLARGFPTRRDEDWKYTDLKPIVSGGFDPGQAPADGNDRRRAMDGLQQLELSPDIPQLLFVDGVRVPDLLPSVLPPGVHLPDRDETWKRMRTIQSGDHFREYPLVALNTAFASSGTLIRVERDVQVNRPLHLVYLNGSSAGRAAQPNVLIDLGRGASLCVVQHFAAAKGTGWTNSVTRVTQEEGSRLTLYRLQEHADDHFHTELVHASLARDTLFRAGYVDLGGQLIRNDLRVELAESGAECDLTGVSLAAQGQHVDNHSRIDHIAPNTKSNEAFRCIVGERGRGVFNGKVVVHRGARGTDARQASDNLLLSERGEVNTKPELEIYNDDVKCAHGATVGELDPEKLFYLRSRGVDEETARGLLVFAFANDLLQRIEVPELKDRVISAVAGHLPDYRNWGGLL